MANGIVVEQRADLGHSDGPGLIQQNDGTFLVERVDGARVLLAPAAAASGDVLTNDPATGNVAWKETP